MGRWQIKAFLSTVYIWISGGKIGHLVIRTFLLNFYKCLNGKSISAKDGDIKKWSKFVKIRKKL